MMKLLESAPAGIDLSAIAAACNKLGQQERKFVLDFFQFAFKHTNDIELQDTDDETLLQIEKAITTPEKYDNKKLIDPQLIKIVFSCIDRLRAVQAGESMPGWETEKADLLLREIRAMASRGVYFVESFEETTSRFTRYNDNTDVGSLIATIIRLYLKDKKFTSKETERQIRSNLTLCWGTLPHFRMTFVDLMAAIFRCTELIDLKYGAEAKDRISRLEEVLRPLLKWKSYVTETTLIQISDASGELISENMTYAFMHFLKFGNFDTKDMSIKTVDSLIAFGTMSNHIADNLLERWSATVTKKVKMYEKWEKIPAEYSQNSTDRPYGKFIFAQRRTQNDVPPEEDTARERLAFAALQDHILNNEPLPQDVALELMGQLEDGSYQSILRQPTVDYVYRGMTLTAKGLAKMLGINVDRLTSSGSVELNKFMKTRRGSEGSSSWSLDLSVAIDYAKSYMNNIKENEEWSVIFVARTGDNAGSFIQGPNGLYDIAGLDSYKTESEAVALGPIKVYKVYWEAPTQPEHTMGSVVDIKERNLKKESIATLRGYIKRVLAS